MIDQLSDVQSKNIGGNSRIWQFVVILPGARIGSDCNICSHCLIENDVIIGNRVTIKSGVQLWDRMRVDDDVFIGPNVSFANDKFPRSKSYPEKYLETTICRGASIGAGATILPGIRIGEKAMVGAGAVVTRSVPPHAIVVGNPARIIGYVDTIETGRIESQQLSKSGDSSDVNRSYVRGVVLKELLFVKDLRGNLTGGEFLKQIPFEPKRYFAVLGVPDIGVRGEHAHRECHQFLVCIQGSCNLVVDDGLNRQEIILDSPNIGLYLPPLIWGIQYKYSADAVLLVFASDYYDPMDYIRDYNEFLEIVNQVKQ